MKPASRRSLAPRPRRSLPRHRLPVGPTGASALLQLMWLASPALPVGGFSYSEGFESAVDDGRVTSEAQAADWLLDQLQLGLARSEIAIVAAAFGAWRCGQTGAAGELNNWFVQTRESSELRRQTEQMGRSMVEWLKNRSVAIDPRVQELASFLPAPCWPVAFALAAQQTGAPLRDALLAFTFGWAENMVQAAMKTVPLGQAAGQRVLSALVEAIPLAVEQANGLAASQRQAHAPMLAILSARHERQYSRLFRS